MINRGICLRLCAGFLYESCRILGFLIFAAAANAANPVQIENAKPGTAEWQRSNTAENTVIAGFASATSVTRGQTIGLYVSTSAPSYVIDVYRLGWYNGAGGRWVHTSPTRAGIAQPMPSPDPTGLIECNWTAPYALSIPGDWVSGIYLAKLTASNSYQSYIIFTVRDDDRAPAAAYLYQSAVNTWQAYNGWGGRSLYAAYSSDGIQAQRASFNRPYSTASAGTGDFFGAELNLVRFLEREGYDVSYATNVDLHEQGAALIAPHKALLSAGHDEYWSYQMKSAAQQARDQGKHIAFFGANAVYWQMRYQPGTHPAAAANRVMISYKESAEAEDPYSIDADPANDKYITTRFRDLPEAPYNVVDSVAQPENGLIGVMYHGNPFDGDIVVADASNWAFNDTGVGNGSHLPGLLGYENDAIFANGYSPAGLQKLAESPDDWGFAHSTIYPAPSGALVFATGSIQWSWGLDDYGVPWGRTSRLSGAAQQATRNILNRFAIVKPGAPTNPVALRGNTQATISFGAPASDGGGAITGYTVSSNPVGGIDSDAGSTSLHHVVTGLVNGTPYTFTVTAANVAGTGPASAPSNSVTPSTAPVAPGPPTAVTAFPGSAQAAVAFNTPASNGGAAIDGYTVSSNPPGGVDIHGGTLNLTHVVTGLANGAAYTFTVTAHNSAGTGIASAPSSPVTPAGPPGKPLIGTAVAGNAQATVYFSAPASNGGHPIIGYTVTSNPEGRSGVCTASPCSVIGLSNGMPYEFRVTATNSSGQSLASDPSATVVPTALLTNPAMRSVASLLTARKNHSASLLNSGKLLVAGGANDSGSLASAELYDPASDAWSYTPSMANARRSHTATLLPSGKVLIAGGQGAEALASAELYDPLSNSWSPAASMSSARHSHSATLLANGKVLVAGGQNAAGMLAGAELYDPASDSWAAAGNMSAARESHTATLMANGKVLIAGGWANAITELYNPAANSWSTAAELPTGQYGAAAALLPNGKALLAGGYDNSNYLASDRLYDATANTWRAAANMLSARELHTATALLNGKVFVAGGITNSAGNLAGNELYNAAADAWSGTLPLANGRIYHSASLLANGKVALVGGQLSVALSSVEMYDPGTSVAAPGAPGAVSAIGGDGQATVSFNAPSDDGGSAITGYSVQSHPPGGVDQQAGTMSLNRTLIGLANGTDYTFTVSASNSLGSGKSSVPSNSVTPAAAPLAVTGAASSISASGATLAGSITARGASVTVIFDFGASAAYGSTANASPATTTPLYIGTVNAVLSGLSCNTTYHYRVRTISSAGSANGADASFATNPCAIGVPGNPVIISVAPGPGRTTISFLPPANHGTSAITSYTATCIAAGHPPRSATGASTPITVTGLSSPISYSCSVTANNSVGSSAPSAALSVTPSGTSILPPLMLLLLN